MKATITYIGEAGSNVWGGVDLLPAVTFEKNVAREIDTSKVPGAHKGFYTHLIKKARSNRFFKVADVKGASANANASGVKAEEAEEPKKTPSKTRARKALSAKTLSAETLSAKTLSAESD